VSATRICFPRVPSSRSPQLITSLHVRQLNSGLSNRPQHCTIATMQSLKQVLLDLFLPAIFLACLPIAAHAGPADCELNKVALARAVAKDARLHFIAGASKPSCPSAERACRLRAYVVPGDEVLVDAAEGLYVCAFFKSQRGTETRAFLPRAARQWAGNWERDREAQIIIKSSGDEVEVSGSALWGSYDPERVKRGDVHVGGLEGKGRPRGQTLAIGYDPDQSDFPPGKDAPPDSCAAKLELYGRYLVVEDNLGCGGLNVSFTGTYVRVKSLRPLGGL
jgi:hypothetical protein